MSVCVCVFDFEFGFILFLFKQKTAYEMRISDWSSDVCSSDLAPRRLPDFARGIGIDRCDRQTHDQIGPGRTPDEHADDRRRDDRQIGEREIGRASWRERVCQYV